MYNPNVLADRLADMTRDDWLHVLNSLEPSIIEKVTNNITHKVIDDKASRRLVDSVINTLNQNMRDADTYRMLPSELRIFLESSSDTMYILAHRLIEAVNARNQVSFIQDYLYMIKETEEKCKKCEMMNIIGSIKEILNSSFVDYSP